MWYRVNCGNKTSLQPSIKDARWKAFEFLIQNKKDLVLIISKSNDTVIGTARYVNKKDKFGAKIGPVYWDARRNSVLRRPRKDTDTSSPAPYPSEADPCRKHGGDQEAEQE